jgi:hypothetical protein
MRQGDLVKVKARSGFINRPPHIRALAGREGLLLKTYPNAALMWIILIDGSKQFVWPSELEKVCASED